ncbi:MAG: cupin domain-containing protein [Gemmatimonadetes bacterium]|jgi:quercetin dioxygenase-like cupin family protein|nr:cupin domain-containing protein [Gemmatimonadota bacterium]MCC7322954.1 cupin domain-containing protein [Gemmatimonadaceae bacterium]MBK6845053.1 cupin domain-containing protein [Gemmatimonadota bacterium]MBK7831599.1 cupin domain-containing protein [Gemmatimonadota bacterium]MBK8059799.1 cupin domain-containing protein [Gemmatimonadota bacterium]
MSFHIVGEQPEREVFPGHVGRFVHSERMTFAFWRITQGAQLPAHSHPHEQVAHVLRGEYELTIDGVPHRCVPGTMAVIPPNAVHYGRAITDCEILDVFAPVREDYRG